MAKAETSPPIKEVHAFSHQLEIVLGDQLIDIVPAYDSIGIFTKLSIESLMGLLKDVRQQTPIYASASEVIEVPICYELGLDWEVFCNHSHLSKEQIISIHLAGIYRSVFIGFTPGFVYADGLDERLACPRKDSPRTYIAPGSVGIGGCQTGIYALEGPGGWNIIGRTPVKIFDIHRATPSMIEIGDHFSFLRISKEAFDQWES